MRRLHLWFLLPVIFLLPCTLDAQVPNVGVIGGEIRVAGEALPPRQIMVELRFRESTINTVYAEGQGGFAFSNLAPNPYHVVIHDDAYYPVDEVVVIRPESPYTTVQITLRPREPQKKDDPLGDRAKGGSPYLVDPADYNKRFPKKALQEYQRGLEAEQKGKRDDAIGHYVAALKIAPDYYPAHNNLGSLYLGAADFKLAEEHFREAVRLDANEGQAYFNLANLLMLTGRYGESEDVLTAGLQRRPDSAFGHFLEGCVFERSGKFDDAEKSLRQALQLEPAMSQAQLQLVNLYLKQKRKDDAVAQLQDFLKAFPTAPAAAQAKSLLNRLQASASPENH